MDPTFGRPRPASTGIRRTTRTTITKTDVITMDPRDQDSRQATVVDLGETEPAVGGTEETADMEGITKETRGEEVEERGKWNL